MKKFFDAVAKNPKIKALIEAAKDKNLSEDDKQAAVGGAAQEAIKEFKQNGGDMQIVLGTQMLDSAINSLSMNEFSMASALVMPIAHDKQKITDILNGLVSKKSDYASALTSAKAIKASMGKMSETEYLATNTLLDNDFASIIGIVTGSKPKENGQSIKDWAKDNYAEVTGSTAAELAEKYVIRANAIPVDDIATKIQDTLLNVTPGSIEQFVDHVSLNLNGQDYYSFANSAINAIEEVASSASKKQLPKFDNQQPIDDIKDEIKKLGSVLVDAWNAVNITAAPTVEDLSKKYASNIKSTPKKPGSTPPKFNP